MDRVRYKWILQQVKATRSSPSKQWFKEINGQLFRINNGQWLKVIQDFEKNIILNGLHSDPLSGHFGSENTLKRIKQKYFWPNMSQDINQFVQSCDICQRRHGKGTQIPIHPIPTGQPFEKIGIDLIGPLPITATRK
jgi:Integrase zinc binding domain